MPLGTFLNGRGPTRGVLWLALSDEAKVLKRTEKSDSGGGYEDTYTAQGAVPARIDPLGGGEGELAARISDRSTHLVTLPLDTEVSLPDDIEVVGVGRFEITAIRDSTAKFALMVEVTGKT